MNEEEIASSSTMEAEHKHKASTLTIEDLPDEVLEFILDLLPPYKDIHDCMAVSKRWRRCVLNMVKTKKRNLIRAITEFDIAWKMLTPDDMAPSITKRYSHSAVVHENSMYVFGGCSCTMTTFNDLWRLDLSKRVWVRPLTMGTYPQPKACSTMVCHNDSLVLFGGWTYPPSYPLHQTWHLFNELHTYDIRANRWTCISTTTTPPPTAGHSASVARNWMIVFGGLQRGSNVVHSTKTNDIWKLNLDTWTWYKQATMGHVKPSERYGQSQTALDDDNILIMGGSGGPSHFLADIWVLNMSGETWRWIKVDVRNGAHAPPSLWCNPVCKVDDKIFVLSKSWVREKPRLMYVSRGVWVPPAEPRVGEQQHIAEVAPRPQARIDMADRVFDRDENVNGRRGTLKGARRLQQPEAADTRQNEQPEEPIAGPSSGLRIAKAPTDRPLGGMAAFNEPPSNAKSDAKRLLREAKMKQSEERLKKMFVGPQFVARNNRNLIGMYVLDVAHALDEVDPYVTWLRPPGFKEREVTFTSGSNKDNAPDTGGPEETLLYTLVSGKSELIMFGGIQRDAGSIVASTSNLRNQVSNSLFFITAPRYVI